MACCPEHGGVLARLLDFIEETEKDFAYKYEGLNDFENYYVISNIIPGNKATKQDLEFLVPEAKKLYQKAIEQYKLVIFLVISVAVNVWLGIENREMKGQIRWLRQKENDSRK